MKNQIRILHLEDNDLDAEIIENKLQEEGIECSITRASCKKEYFSTIHQNDYDIILSDNSLPDYDGLSALKYAREQKPQIPFIFISGTIGEERAIEALRYGARDYVLKENLNKLAPAIQRVIHESKIERAHIQAVNELKASEEKYRRLVNEVSDGFYITDEQGALTFSNNALAKMLGFSKSEEIINHNISEFIPKDKVAEITHRYQNYIKNKKSADSFEVEIQRPDGLTVWLELTSSSIQENGKVVGVQGVIRNITERKQVEEILRQSEAKFRKLISSLPDAVLVVNTEGRIIFCNNNTTKIFNYTLDEILSCTVEDLIPKRFKESHLDLRNGYLSNPQGRAMGDGKELFALRKDGSEFPTEIMLEPVEINNNLFILAIIRDITEKKKMIDELIAAKEKAEEMNKVKNSFLSNMSHELRTPLISVLGFAELLQQELENHEHLEFVNNIIEGGQRLNNTLSGILEISKLETANSFVKLQSYNLADEIQTRVKSFLPIAQSKRLFLTTELSDTYLTAHIDSELFGKALYHLVSNGIKFTKKGGVFVSLHHEKKQNLDWAVIKVIDTGVGIPKENIQNIFQEFRQASEGHSRSHEGTGLGLTIAKRIVELMKGHIQVESEVAKRIRVFHLAAGNSR